MIKQLFFDLDGTLLNSRGHVSPANQAAIQKTSCDISLVSARAPQEMLSTVRSLNLTNPRKVHHHCGHDYSRTELAEGHFFQHAVALFGRDKDQPAI